MAQTRIINPEPNLTGKRSWSPHHSPLLRYFSAIQTRRRVPTKSLRNLSSLNSCRLSTSMSVCPLLCLCISYHQDPFSRQSLLPVTSLQRYVGSVSCKIRKMESNTSTGMDKTIDFSASSLRKKSHRQRKKPRRAPWALSADSLLVWGYTIASPSQHPAHPSSSQVQPLKLRYLAARQPSSSS